MFKRTLILFVGLAFSVAGYYARDSIESAHAAVGSGISGGSSFSGNIGTATGTRLTLTQGISAVTGDFSGTVTANRLALTQGVSASTGIFTSTNGTALQATGQGTGHGLSAVGSATTASDAVRATAGNTGGESDAVHAIGANGVDSYAVRAVGAGATGRGVRIDVSGGGYPLVIIPDTTSPASPHMNLSPQTIPSACADGDVSLQTGGYLRTCTGTNTYSSLSNTGLKSTVAGAGTTEADDTEIAATAEWVTVTGNNGTVGVGLPTGAVAKCVRIMAQSPTVTNILKVYAASADDSDSINGVDGDTAYLHIAGASLVYCTADGTAWFTY